MKPEQLIAQCKEALLRRHSVESCKTYQALIQLLSGEQSEVDISVTDSEVVFSWEEIRLTSNLDLNNPDHKYFHQFAQNLIHEENNQEITK
jgi:hypothetical protein